MKIFVKEICEIPVKHTRTAYVLAGKTTDYRRKLLIVRFNGGYTWAPKKNEIKKLTEKMEKTYNFNLLFSDPDKER